MNSIFKLLLDTATDLAYALTKVNIGQAINAAVNGMAVFGFRDSAGQATMPQLNDEGALPVVFDAGTCLTIPAATKTKAEIEAAWALPVQRLLLGEMDLIADRTYTSPAMKVTATRLTLFQLIKVEDVGVTDVETLIDFTVLEAGQTNFADTIKDKFSTDANVDTKKLRLYATLLENSGKGSDVWGKASANLVAAN
jgi:hypothetical protein